MFTQSPALITEPDRRRYAPLQENTTTDVVVIGGGAVGLLTAWALQERGASAVLLERGHLLAGETAYTTGFLSRLPDAPLPQLRERYGGSFVREILAGGREAQGWLFGLLERQAAAGFRHRDTFLFSRQANDPTVGASWEAIQDLDPTAERVIAPPSADALRIRDEGAAELRPGLLALLERPHPQLRVFEETAVSDLRVRRQTVAVRTAKAAVLARAVILANGDPSQLVPSLKPQLRTAVTYVSLARYPTTAPLPNGLWWDTLEPYHYLRRVDAQTVMIGGADEWLPRTAGGTAGARHAELETFLREWLSGSFTVTRRWSGVLHHSQDHLPLVGVDPERGPAVAYAAAFAGNGLVYGALTARMLAAQATGGHHAAEALFDPARLAKR